MNYLPIRGEEKPYRLLPTRNENLRPLLARPVLIYEGIIQDERWSQPRLYDGQSMALPRSMTTGLSAGDFSW